MDWTTTAPSGPPGTLPLLKTGKKLSIDDCFADYGLFRLSTIVESATLPVLSVINQKSLTRLSNLAFAQSRILNGMFTLTHTVASAICLLVQRIQLSEIRMATVYW